MSFQCQMNFAVTCLHSYELLDKFTRSPLIIDIDNRICVWISVDTCLRSDALGVACLHSAHIQVLITYNIPELRLNLKNWEKLKCLQIVVLQTCGHYRQTPPPNRFISLGIKHAQSFPYRKKVFELVWEENTEHHFYSFWVF